LILFPNCKINLGLNILRKREDGYHDLETVFYPLSLKDAVEVIKTNGETETSVHFTSSGLEIAGEEKDNLCVKAYHLLKKDFPQLPSIELHLHKNIPMGAGLGGGSADGAFVLMLLNEKFKLSLSKTQLIDYALQLGSDCPFFILNKPCFAQGRGELMHPQDINLAGYRFVIVKPGIHVSTGWAFASITPKIPVKSIKEIIQQPVGTWKEELMNDFEAPVAAKYPEISHIKNQLYKNGALYASMTGSGSSVIGIFSPSVSPVFSFPDSWFVQVL